MDLLVSVLILGLFLVPLAISRNNVILQAGDTLILREARMLAMQKMGELELETEETLVGSGGDFGEKHPNFVWETRVERVMLGDVVGFEEEDPWNEPVLTPEEQEAQEAREIELLRIELTVRYAPEGGLRVSGDLEDEERTFRPADRIVMVRYRIAEPEEELP
jgi:hypothetical protein